MNKEEKKMSKQRRRIEGHYLDGTSFGFAIGVIGGALLFRGFGIWPGLIAIAFYFSIDFLEKRSYNQIKDSFGEENE